MGYFQQNNPVMLTHTSSFKIVKLVINLMNFNDLCLLLQVTCIQFHTSLVLCDNSCISYSLNNEAIHSTYTLEVHADLVQLDHLLASWK